MSNDVSLCAAKVLAKGWLDVSPFVCTGKAAPVETYIQADFLATRLKALSNLSIADLSAKICIECKAIEDKITNIHTCIHTCTYKESQKRLMGKLEKEK